MDHATIPHASPRGWVDCLERFFFVLQTLFAGRAVRREGEGLLHDHPHARAARERRQLCRVSSARYAIPVGGAASPFIVQSKQMVSH